MVRKFVSAAIISLSITAFCLTGISDACSLFRVTGKDGTIISTRTMEFGAEIGYGLVRVPRGRPFVSPAPGNNTGIRWNARYGYVGANAFGDETMVMDGLNEKGLSFSYLWYETDMKWQQVEPGETGTALAHVLLGSWVLGNFATVGEVKKEIEKIRVFGFHAPQMGMAPPLHAAMQDAAGGSIVIEYNNGRVEVFDNPLGVMTNAPDFPWMVTNLRNYIAMSPVAPPATDYAGVKLRPTGHGAGMWGLPGDLTPPSRFVRLAVLTHMADRQADSAKTLNLAQHIANTFDIVRGMAVDKGPDGKITASETTQWTFFRDLTNKVLYFKTYDNFNLRKIDLKKVDFEGKTTKTVPLYGDGETIKDITDRIR